MANAPTFQENMSNLSKEVFSSPNLSLAFANLTCYFAMTTLFFSQIGAKQYDMTLLDKNENMRLFATHASARTREMICARRARMLADGREEAAKQRETRESSNRSLLRRRVGPAVLVFGTLSAYFFVRAYSGSSTSPSEKWTRAHTTLMTFVLLCFSTELFVFGLVLLPHEKIGDFAIVDRLVQPVEKDPA